MPFRFLRLVETALWDDRIELHCGGSYMTHATLAALPMAGCPTSSLPVVAVLTLLPAWVYALPTQMGHRRRERTYVRP
jgi:hypothetical protein